jgi:hypothetical protein
MLWQRKPLSAARFDVYLLTALLKVSALRSRARASSSDISRVHDEGAAVAVELGNQHTFVIT